MVTRYVDLELGERETNLELAERPGLRPKLLRLEDNDGYWTFESDEKIAFGYGHPPVGALDLHERNLDLNL